MSLKTFEKDIIEEMQQGLEFYDKELVKIRTNRVHPSLIENDDYFLVLKNYNFLEFFD